MILENASATFNVVGSNWAFWMIDYYDKTGETISRKQYSPRFTRDMLGRPFMTDTIYLFAARQPGGIPCYWAVGFRIPDNPQLPAEPVLYNLSVLIGHAVYDDPDYFRRIENLDDEKEPTTIDSLHQLWQTPAFQNAQINQLHNN